MSLADSWMHDLDDTKPLKVTLPVSQHLSLHKLKVLTGRTISSIVCAALDDYMAALDEDSDDGGAEPDDPLQPA